MLTLIFAGNVLGRTLHVAHKLSSSNGTRKGNLMLQGFRFKESIAPNKPNVLEMDSGQ